MKARFCPKCGATDKPFVRGFCRDCFAASRELVVFPVKLELQRCRECEKILLNGRWLAFSEDHVVSVVKSKIKIRDLSNLRFALDCQWGNESELVVSGKVLGEIDSELFDFPIQTTVLLKSTLCSDCSKLSADYYEAVIQVRLNAFSKKQAQELLNEIQRFVHALFKSDSLSRITKVATLPNGFDAYVGSKRAAKTAVEQLAHKHTGQVTRSFSLVGVDKSGKTKKRFTFLVRI